MRVSFIYNGKLRVGSIEMLFNGKNKKGELKDYMKVRLEEQDDVSQVKTFKLSKCSYMQLLENSFSLEGIL